MAPIYRWAPIPKWQGTPVRVDVLDTDAFHLNGQAPGLPQAMVKALELGGCHARLIPPSKLASALERQKPGLLVISGLGFDENAAPDILAFLKHGGGLWLIGRGPILSKAMVKLGAKWVSDPAYRAPVGFRRILDGQNLRFRARQFATPDFQLTARGRRWFPFFFSSNPATSAAILSANNSTCYLATPPWVSVTPILQVGLVQKNWVFQNDLFTGWIMALFRYGGGRFAGARVLYCGLPCGQSLLSPSRPTFAATVIACAQRLAVPYPLHPWTRRPPLVGLPPLTRKNYFRYPGPIFMPLDISGAPQRVRNPLFWENLRLAGFNAFDSGIVWRRNVDAAGNVIDWPRMDRVVTAAQKHGLRVVFDPYTFAWNQMAWAGPQGPSGPSFYNPLFRKRFIHAMNSLAKRYAGNPAVVAMFATPYTGTSSFHIDATAAGKVAWQQYVRKTLGLSLSQAERRYSVHCATWADLPLPRPTLDRPYNLGPLWSDYLQFFIRGYHRFMRQVIKGIRSQCPDMPLILRGSYLDVAINMTLASEFSGVETHCECIETSPDVEGYYRGLGLRYGVPTSAENGWPKSRGGPLRMALASFLLGGYNDFMYSFGGPEWARPSLDAFYNAEEDVRALHQRHAHYPASNVALLNPDTTLYMSRPDDYRSIQDVPHLEFLMERLGFNFECVAAQFPKLNGLKVIIDDGANEVLTAHCRNALIRWVREGGDLIVFPRTGQYTLDGSASLPAALGINFDCPPGPQGLLFSRVIPVGKGRIIELPFVPANHHNKPAVTYFSRLLVRLGAIREVKVSPRVNSACFNAPGRTYVVLCNKSHRYVHAFFRESTLPAAKASLPDLTLKLTPSFAFREAKDVGHNLPLPMHHGAVTINLDRTHFTVVEFKR
ncbi:MAG: hypothetical protein HKL95_05290 [Phycisphaerae bacterium]|nr:hypothetical protein [Phycisphaerae bacterium]